MAEIWFTSDTHFGHANIPKYCPGRVDTYAMEDEGDIGQMNEAMVAIWNDHVRPDDEVYHLGDLAMGKIADSLEYVRQLHGKITLILGNHDRPHEIMSKTPEKRARWHREYTDAGIDKMLYDWHVEIGGCPVTLSHFPYTGDHMDEERYQAWRPADHGHVLVHGHVHDLWQTNGRMINVGMDAWNGRLLHVDEVAELVHKALD